MDGELHRHSMVVDRHGACVLGVTEPDWLRGMGSSHTGLLHCHLHPLTHPFCEGCGWTSDTVGLGHSHSTLTVGTLPTVPWLSDLLMSSGGFLNPHHPAFHLILLL